MTSSSTPDTVLRVLCIDARPHANDAWREVWPMSIDPKIAWQVAASVDIAREVVESARLAEVPVDVVTVSMAEDRGQIAAQAIEELTAAQPETHFIFLSDHPSHDFDVLRTAHSEADRYLIVRLPLDHVILLQMTRALGSKAQSERESRLRANALEQLFAEQDLLLSEASDFVYRVDETGNVRYVSNAFFRQYGLDERSFINHYRSWFEDRGGPLVNPTAIRINDASGNTRLVELVERSSSDPENFGWVGVGRDVTERTRLQQELERAQRLESVGRLAGGVAHDFNNLLMIIHGEAELAQEVPELAPESLHTILEATEQAAELTKSLLLFSKDSALGDLSAINLSELLLGAEKLFRRTLPEYIELRLQLESQHLICASPSDLNRVLTNLLVNAADAMPDGGTVTIRTSDENVAGHSRVRLQVQDSGVGMDPEVQARVFEPFFTTKIRGRGTGLGLAVVRGVIEKLNGELQLHSKLGRGTEFIIDFPTVDSNQSLRPPAPLTHQRGSGTIILAEDDSRVLELTRRVLEQAGFHVVAFKDPRDAAEIEQDTLQSAALLLSDVVMPHLTGPKLVARLRARRPDLPCLLMSGYTDQSSADLGVDTELLRKPWSKDDLLARIAQLMKQEVEAEHSADESVLRSRDVPRVGS